MTFYVGQRFRKNIRILRDDKDIEYGNWTTPQYYWVFEFANGETAYIIGSQSNHTLAFDVPADFFTDERIGPLKWKVLVLDLDGTPVIDTPPRTDRLERNIKSAQELGLIS